MVLFLLLKLLQLILDRYANSPGYVMLTCHTALTYKTRVCQHLPGGYPVLENLILTELQTSVTGKISLFESTFP